MNPILTLEGVSKRFGGLQAIADVSFAVRPGEIVGLIGPNGAGKTTLFNLLVGLERPDRGSIALEGSAIAGLKPHRIAARGMTKTFQNVALFSEMSVLDNVLAAGLLRHSVAGARDLARRSLERVGLAAVEASPAGELSFPERARVELARALCTEPKVLLLDEVMAALNAAEMESVLSLIRRLRDESGLTLLVVEHHMRAVMSVCDRILVLNFGRLIADGTPAVVARNPEVVHAYLGAPYEAA
jgi:branched-chain amino acid transport system ATP-binding protein